MAHRKHVDLVLEGWFAVEEWRRRHPDTQLNLTHAQLSGVDLSAVNLSHGNLSGADLSNSNLAGAILIEAALERTCFTRADLSNSKLDASDLTEANLSYADLSGASLNSAVLSNTDFHSAKLHQVDFADADLFATQFCDVDLSKCRNLSAAQHGGPSSLDLQTLVNSRGAIPTEFLRGCGVPSWLIPISEICDPAMSAEQVSELLTVQMFHERASGPMYLGGIFISYSHVETELVMKLRDRLIDNKASVWLDRHNFVAGSVEQNISRAIRFNDTVIVVLSQSALRSKWVWDEINLALEREEREGRDFLCPIRVDEACFSAQRNKRHLMRELKERTILDFSNWESTASFESEFEKLLTGLKIHFPPKSNTSTRPLCTEVP